MKGPYQKIYQDAAIPNQRSIWARTWYRTTDGQKVRTPLPYRYMYGDRVSPFIAGSNYRGIFPSNVQDATNLNHQYVVGLRTFVHNKAYAKWLDKIGERLQVGADFAEGRQTLNMVTAVAKALDKPLRAWRKALRNPPKAIAGGYLAWHFGVEPLVKEMYTLLDLFEKGVQKNLKATAQSKGFNQRITFYTGNSSKTTYDYHVTVRHTGYIKVVSENLRSLVQLGVANPFSVAWEATPLSFVVDWLYPVQLYLEQLDALFGLKVENPYTTTRIKLKVQHTPYKYPAITPGDPAVNTTAYFTGFGFHRTLGVPAPVLQKTLNPWSTSVTRALTSIALLVQALPRR